MKERREQPPSYLVPVSGFARSFFSGYNIRRGTISVWDASAQEIIAVDQTNEEGKFGPFQLEPGRRVFFRFEKDQDSWLLGYRTTQTRVFTIPEEGIHAQHSYLFNVSLQVPSNPAFTLFSYLMWIAENRECGQIAVTVTLPGTTMDHIPQGEPGVEVFLFREGESEPLVLEPYYLGIMPLIDKTDFTGFFGRHQRTSADGGVLFRNVPAGHYRVVAVNGNMRAEISVVVHPGVLTNASPAWGLVMEESNEYSSSVP